MTHRSAAPLLAAFRAVLLACTLVLAPAMAGGFWPGFDALRAQTTAQATDYEEWAGVAQRAEEAISGGKASDAAYEDLRGELVNWREIFLAEQDVNSARIETVTNQIAALGPAPEEGQTEPGDVAARRAELNSQLEELRAPVLRAEEALQRAEGLVREIDTLIASRSTEALLERQVTPVSPANWAAPVSRLRNSLSATLSEISGNWQLALGSTTRRDDLPFAILLLLVSLALMLRGRVWTEKLAARAEPSFGGGLSRFALSTGQVLVPWIGTGIFVRVVESTGVLGLRGTAIVAELPTLVLAVTLSLWVAGRLFPKDGDSLLIPPMEPLIRNRLRRLAGLIGLVFGLHGILASLCQQEGFEPAITTVLYFPGIVLEGLLLYRLGQVLQGQVRLHSEDERVGAFQASSLRLVSRVTMLIGVLAPVAAAFGYTNAALKTVFPAAESLVLLGILAILHRVVVMVHCLLTRGTLQQSQNSLLPISVSFLLALGSLPLFALIWGTRKATLIEFWSSFREGITIGETRISPTDFLTFLLVFAVGYGLTRLFQNALRTTILPKTRLDPGGQNAIISGLGYVGIFLAAVIAITSAGIDLSSLAIVAGALSVGIGFGLQNIVSNFVSGIILLVERPIGEGDWIEVGGNMGIVKAISVRSTRIETFDRTQVIVPNADFVSGTVTNWTRGNITGRLMLKVGVAYGTDTRRVEDILREVASSHEEVVTDPPPAVTFAAFGADALEFEIRAILHDVNTILGVRNELNHRINERFIAEGIEVPFAQRDVWLRNPETLAAGRPAPATPAGGTAPGTATGAAVQPAREMLTRDDLGIEGHDPTDGDDR